MSVWNPLVNTGFLFITSWKKTVRSSLLIPNTLRLSVERKLTRKKNRLQNCLTVSNIQLGNVVSDTFGKSAQAILDKILENPADTSFDLEPLVFRSLKKKLPELYDAIDGYITPEQAGKLKVIKAHYENLESRKAELEEIILALAAPYQQELAILQTRNRYLRLKKRRGHKKAIIAIARMLLTALYHMLKNGKIYNAELYRKSDLPPVDREITVEQALMMARNQGYKIKSVTA